MAIALRTEHTKFSEQEIQDAVSFALRNEAEQARSRRDYFADLCADYEAHYGYSSDAFLEQFEEGILGDDESFFDWYAAKNGLDLWERRYQILRGVSV